MEYIIALFTSLIVAAAVTLALYVGESGFSVASNRGSMLRTILRPLMSPSAIKENPVPLVLALYVTGCYTAWAAGMDPGFLADGIMISGLCFIMGTMFSMVSRSRNRDNQSYHVLASMTAQVVYLLVLKELVSTDVAASIIPFYAVGMAVGSVSGAKASMVIEKYLFASADGHLAS